jgi:hypothetical protein
MNEAEQTVYEDRDAPQGQRRLDAPSPGWLDSAMRRINDSILQVIMHEQHEYLENKRLPHTLKQSDALVKPYLLKDGQVIVATVFPVASEHNYVCCFTPIYDRGYSIFDNAKIPEDVAVLGYNLFVYKENGPLAVNNQPIQMADYVQEELCRIAREMKLRYSQFVYFTLLTPRVADGFEDPHNNLANLIPRTHTVEEKAAPAQPTPID